MSDTQKIVHLPDIPVYQGIYCPQELTDRLCRYVCENKPEFVQELIEQEKLPFPDNRDAMLTKALNRIEYYLCDEAREGRVPELSMLGMTDFLYEIDRRVRKSLGLFDIPVVGTPLAPTPDGPFPELIVLPVWRNAQGDMVHGVTQELINEYALLAYKKNYEISYAFCEHERRLLRSGRARYILIDRIGNIMSENGKKGIASAVVSELCNRLRAMSNFPSYGQMRTLEQKGSLL